MFTNIKVPCDYKTLLVFFCRCRQFSFILIFFRKLLILLKKLNALKNLNSFSTLQFFSSKSFMLYLILYFPLFLFNCWHCSRQWFLHSCRFLIRNFLISNIQVQIFNVIYNTYSVWPHTVCSCCECFHIFQCEFWYCKNEQNLLWKQLKLRILGSTISSPTY